MSPDTTITASRPDPIRTVFEEWVHVTGKSGRTVLDARRRELIGRRLKDYPLEDVMDAVRGWRWSPHHRGQNETGTVYHDLGLLLRDAAHLERFRDLERGIGRPVAMGRGDRAVAVQLADAAAKGATGKVMERWRAQA